MPTSWAIIFSEGFAPRQKHYNILFTYDYMIDLAEKTYNIPVRKNSGAK